MPRSLLKTFIFMCLFSLVTSVIFAQEELQKEVTIEDPKKNTQEFTIKIRENMAKKQYATVFSSLSTQLLDDQAPIIKTWFFYVMWAEVAKITGNLSFITKNLPSTGGFLVFSRALSLWNSGDALSAARLLATISKKEPSLNYLVGKLYMSAGKLYQGAGYLYLGGDMREAPYGLYYAGLGQNAVGKFSKASSFLSNASSMLLEDEQDLGLQIQLQRAVAQFGRENFKDAYEMIMPVYQKEPINVLTTLDPGIILTAMNRPGEARDFWNQALKQTLPASISTQIRKNLNYNKRLIDPDYPPLWLRH